MAGRNSKPKNRGPASHPSRLEQFDEKWAEGRNTKSAEAADSSESK